MALAILNPILNCVNGRIGNVVFYRRHGKQCVRTHVIPRNPDTDAQRTVRRSFAGAVKSWQLLPRDEKFKYSRKAKNMNMSGYNLYISVYMKDQVSVQQKPASGLNIPTERIKSDGKTIIFPSVSYSYKELTERTNSFMRLQYAPG